MIGCCLYEITYLFSRSQKCPNCAPDLYKKLDDVYQQISTISQAICSSSNANYSSSVGSHQLQQNGFQGMNNIRSSSRHVLDKRSIVDSDLFKRCESEEQLLDTPGDIGKSF